jgi:hypothetical protein
MGKCRVVELGEGAAVEVRAGKCDGVEAGSVTRRCASRTSWQIAVRSFRVVGEWWCSPDSALDGVGDGGEGAGLICATGVVAVTRISAWSCYHDFGVKSRPPWSVLEVVRGYGSSSIMEVEVGPCFRLYRVLVDHAFAATGQRSRCAAIQTKVMSSLSKCRRRRCTSLRRVCILSPLSHGEVVVAGRKSRFRVGLT